jgi:hypothetical protein
MGDGTLSRFNISCLCPGEVIDEKIFEFTTRRITWMQHHLNALEVWSLPPRFHVLSLALTY